jgi:uncharacterized protein (TIGR02444 family)
MPLDAASFWRFSLRIYGLPKVAPTLIACQDEAGADVTLMLFALWRAQAGERLGAEALAQADEAARPWRERAVRPLREVRRFLKTAGNEAIYEQAKALELAAERLEQERLCAAGIRSASAAAPLAAARENLLSYAGLLSRPLPEDALAILLEAFGTIAGGG